MFSLKKRKKSEDTEDANYWLSIGELMASILIIFILFMKSIYLFLFYYDLIINFSFEENGVFRVF